MLTQLLLLVSSRSRSQAEILIHQDFCVIQYIVSVSLLLGRGGGLMISALDSGASGPGSSPGDGDIVLCSWARHFPLTVPLSTEVYKWVSANLIWG